jgi:hypothetical protein
MRTLLCIVFFLFTSSAQAADFVPGIAVASAGKIADPDKSRFSAYYIPAGTKPDAVLTDVRMSLAQAAHEKANLAVIGPDHALNGVILKAALQGAPKGVLQGATILFVNGGEDTQDLNAAAALAGAAFRATPYSPK